MSLHIHEDCFSSGMLGSTSTGSQLLQILQFEPCVALTFLCVSSSISLLNKAAYQPSLLSPSSITIRSFQKMREIYINEFLKGTSCVLDLLATRLLRLSMLQSLWRSISLVIGAHLNEVVLDFVVFVVLGFWHFFDFPDLVMGQLACFDAAGSSNLRDFTESGQVEFLDDFQVEVPQHHVRDFDVIGRSSTWASLFLRFFLFLPLSQFPFKRKGLMHTLIGCRGGPGFFYTRQMPLSGS